LARELPLLHPDIVPNATPPATDRPGLKTRRDAISRTYRETDQPATLVGLCEAYLRLDRQDGLVWAWYGAGLTELARFTDAMMALQTARTLVLEPEHVSFVLERRGDLASRQGDLREAERLYRQALAVTPASQLTLVALGRVLVDQDRSEEAELAFRDAALAGGPFLGLALYEVGRVLRSRAAFFEARRVLREAAALIPQHARVRDVLADVEHAIRTQTRGKTAG
jgi:tetratricopeptide (TPR) repeat protein